MDSREFEARHRKFLLKCTTVGLCVAFCGLGYDQFEEQQNSRNRMMADGKKAREELWTISVASTAVKIPVFPDPSHNCILIRNPQGKVAYSIHGFAVDPKTGRYIGIGGAHNVLKGAINTGMGNFENAQIKVETDVFCAPLDEIVPKVAHMAQAIVYINEQNFSYIAADGFPIDVDAQNSNSLTEAMLAIMGLEMPQENENVWAPGKKRDLLQNFSCLEHVEIKPTTHSLDALRRLTMLSAMEPVPNLGTQLRLSDMLDYAAIHPPQDFSVLYYSAWELTLKNEQSKKFPSLTEEQEAQINRTFNIP